MSLQTLAERRVSRSMMMIHLRRNTMALLRRRSDLTGKRRCASAATLPALVAVMLVCTAMQAASALEIIVPAYFYPSPGSPWGAMTAAADEAPITAIMNPGNGPGNVKDQNYVNAVNAFRAAGGRVIGYVYSSYGARPLAQVTADVDKYKTWYGIDGIFVDEMANTGPAERLNYYKSIYDHVKQVDPQWEVMGNPGTNTIEQYATWPTADRFMVFENVGSAYPGHAPSAWNAKYDSEKFVNLVHTEASAANMVDFLNLAVSRNVGGIYVTDDVMNNPWDTLPSYWQQEVDAVAQINAQLSAGDFNGDGVVDLADLDDPTLGWKARFGSDLGGGDFLDWQRRYTGPAGGAAIGLVPEPPTGCLGAVALVAASLGVTRMTCNPSTTKRKSAANGSS
ncbi:spherulation-specific family 4 protein [Lacipirellula limnantheis]|uniref:Spherulation-specific family 4 n=1 Tax=Lacipirellula limnantheis TaxID=2528024 RepID=A0A517TSN8_9BACT|nr:spherulation-specific family 4 protein [Lacipirellula limnantheis]QDT71383.1 Spherulation-specific family 4 [Lacipirellula limnantheis]